VDLRFNEKAEDTWLVHIESHPTTQGNRRECFSQKMGVEEIVENSEETGGRHAKCKG